jgi:anti-sigma28 factor (negative regulator of flagellin synthesis)
MIRSLGLLLLTVLATSLPGLADDNRSLSNWENIDGVTVQSRERVDQINAYARKSRAAEQKKARESLIEHGFKVQSEDRVLQLNELEEQHRQQEIREIKCTMCTLRCGIVRDAGQASCDGASRGSDKGICKTNADDFMQSCLQQCEDC